MQLEGKRVIVTGGLTGVGRATVWAMMSEGAAVVSVSRAAADSERAVAVITKAKTLGNGKVTRRRLGVSRQAEVDRVVDAAAHFLGGLDVLVNSAGMEQQKPTENLTEHDFQEMFAVNMYGAAYACSAAFRHLKTAGGVIL